MSRSAQTPSERDRRRIRAEAAVWIARIHGPDRSAALEKGLRQWLAEDPLHAAAFELATDVWNESGGTPRGPLPGFGTERREAIHKRLLRPVLATAVVAGLLIVAWLAYLPGGRAISTEKGEQRTVVLADGSRVTLNADSRVDVNFDRSIRTVVLRYGEAYFDVIHNRAQPFVVRAGDRQVVDLGTRFLVSRYGANDESVSVTVIEGRVAVAPLTDIHLTSALPKPDVDIVNAGERLRVQPHTSPVVKAAAIDEATAWLNGQLIFDSTPLGEAASQFNRYNRAKIEVTAPELSRIPVGGVFRIGDSRSFARTVAESHHLKLIASGENLLLEPESPASNSSPLHHP